MICPSCHGLKQIITAFALHSDDSTTFGDTFPCYRCQETGEVPAEMADWIAEGKLLKATRMEPYRTLRKEAARRNMKVLLLSAMETGRIKPIFEVESNEHKQMAAS